MLELKDIDPPEIEMVNVGIPQVECMCCYETATPSSTRLLPITHKEWAEAAVTCGWRQVKTSDTHYSVVCPKCVDELMAIEEDNEVFNMDMAQKRIEILS